LLEDDVVEYLRLRRRSIFQTVKLHVESLVRHKITQDASIYPHLDCESFIFIGASLISMGMFIRASSCNTLGRSAFPLPFRKAAPILEVVFPIPENYDTTNIYVCRD